MNCIKSTRDAYGEALVELGEINKDVVVLDVDVSASTRTVWFAKKFPDRFFNFGVAEANMICAAAGLSRCNKIVFATSLSIFSTTRAFNQIRTTIAACDLPVKIVGTHAGISVGEDGSSHQPIEDIAIMRVLPNMQVIVPADAVETKKVIFESVNIPHPVYIRLGREKVPVIFDDKNFEFKLGKAWVLERGKDVGIIACGLLLHEAIKAKEELNKENISVELVNLSTIKPLDKEYILDLASRVKGIVVAEEHNVIGGVGSAVLEVLANTKHNIKVELVGILDRFGTSGNWRELLQEFNLTCNDIKNAVYRILK
jgi:transketolase